MSARGHWKIQEIMLQRVADALGADFLREVAFVGGCTTGLLITDEASLDAVRFTDDVDLIVHVMGRGSWYRLQQDLATMGRQGSASVLALWIRQASSLLVHEGPRCPLHLRKATDMDSADA